MSGIVNKIKEAVHGDKHSAPEGTHGPHNTRAGNALDPTVDSDRDGSRNLGATGGVRGENYNSNTNTSGAPEGTYGHHNSRLANAADPRIDSDADGSRNLGSTGGVRGENFGSTTGTSNTYGAGPAPNTAGPHRSDALNRADPRVTANPQGNQTFGSNDTYGSTGNTFGTTGQTGRHTGNTLGSSGNTYGTTGAGPAPNTQGPHKHDALNKLDPRVEANPESNTFGGSNTYRSEGEFGTGIGTQRDPTDASQVPPSVLRKHLGDPSIEHDDDTHDREGRHRRMSHQEQYRGL